ncbi:YcnI family copper-binding membrane protein [Streptomyces sp. bgisy100]|uniref:YcnI family copper-binding membrane protein n=1 Tax=Streptomyces sp. bgisy100 TaxID=3413783 RepID=UPI003D70E485
MNLSRLSLVGGVTAGSVLLLAGPAFAHVTVEGEAEKGGFATIAVKVPNERDNASTDKLELNLPADHPLASVMPEPVPGWDVKVTKEKLDKPIEMHGEKITEAVTKVTWTGGKIGPGQFQRFPLAVGQLPENTDQLVFKAIQTYDNDETVRWIEAPKENGEEPESPAPVLALTEPTGEGHSHGSAADAKGGHDHGSGSEESGHGEKAAAGSDSTARVLGVVGIVIGAAGLAFGFLAGRRRSS